MSSFPIIDISSLTQKYLDGESYLKDISADPITKDISKKIVNAFSEYGFIYIKGHNIPESTISSMFKTSEHFFKHESDLKNQFIRTTNDNWGYVPFRLETFEKSRPFDLKECFNFFLRPSPNEQLNIVSPSLVSESTNLFHVCKKLGHLLLKAINLGLNTDDKSNFLYNHHNDIGNYSNNPTTLRLLYYPSIEDESFVQDRQLRCGEHSDYGTITLLFQDEAGGLQVISPSGEYVNATPIPGTIVVNAGDMLQIWSGNRLKSTRHRVVVPTNLEKSRQSIAFFLHPNNDSTVTNLEDEDSNIAVNPHDYLMNMFRGTYY